MSELVGGFIPIGIDCPFRHLCDMTYGEQCKRPQHINKLYSCSLAKMLDLKENSQIKENKGA